MRVHRIVTVAFVGLLVLIPASAMAATWLVWIDSVVTMANPPGGSFTTFVPVAKGHGSERDCEVSIAERISAMAEAMRLEWASTGVNVENLRIVGRTILATGREDGHQAQITVRVVCLREGISTREAAFGGGSAKAK